MFNETSKQLLGIIDTEMGNGGAKLTNERIELIAEFLEATGENGDSGGLDELAKILIAINVVPRPEVEIFRIRIKKVPNGPAPEEVERLWVGTEIMAIKGLPGPIDTYTVLTDSALQALGKKSPEAAEWFRSNLPEDAFKLDFRENEIEIIAPTFEQET